MELRLRPSGFDFSHRGLDGEENHISFGFVNAAPKPALIGESKQSGQTNYLIGRDPSRWLTHLPHFGQVRYSSLYPHIDLVFHGNGEQLEHDFIVTPGGDVRAIRMRLTSPGKLVKNSDGSVKISTSTGDLILTNPSIYQIGDSGKQPREGRFVLKAHNEIGFAVEDYDRTRPLIIDPVLVFSTFLAPQEIDVYGVATDSLGNTYVTGLTFSSSFPAATAGAFQPTCKSCPQYPDVFVMKLNASGSGVDYSTFLGGSSYDQPNAIAVDANGNAIVAGYTQSTDFPVKKSIPFGFAGVGTDYGFVASLSADGSSINYSSLLGGGKQQNQSSDTFATTIALDPSGSAYVSGQTDSPVFPVTSGALDNVVPAYPKNVVFVSKFLTTGSLGYSALIGDTEIVQGGGCCFSGAKSLSVDASGNAYILGRSGALWPTTSGAYQTQIVAPSNEAVFLTKVSADASKLLYSTFVNPDSIPSGLTVDAAGDAFFTGEVNFSFPLTPNAYQKTFPGICCASYLTELDPTGSTLVYSTYFSGSGVFAASTGPQTLSSTIALDSTGNIWLAGTTTDAGFPLVDPIQSTLSTSAFTGFLSEFDRTGTQLLFSTYFGGISQGSQSIDLAVDPNGKAHIAGMTGPDLYVTPGAFLTSVTPPAPNTMTILGFAAVIDATSTSPAVCLGANSSGVPFGPVVVGTSEGITLTVTNCGTSSLIIGSIASSSPAYTVPASGNNCLSPVLRNGSCTFTVVFAPPAAGSFFASLKINANTPIPQTVLGLFGDGTVPIIQVSTFPLTFDPIFVGQTGSTRAVFIQNGGMAPLVINAGLTTVAPTSAFTLQNGCTQPVDPQQSCILFVTFTAPNSPGIVTGTLSIASNDPTNPVVTVGLSGTAVGVYPVPVITTLDHPSVAMGSGSISLGVIGQGFFPTSQVLVNGVPQTTKYNGANFLFATSVDASFFSSMAELTVTVTNPTPGGGVSNAALLTVYQSIPIIPAGLIYDPVSRLLYASVPASAPANANTIIPIDPATGNTGTPIPVGHDPKQFALSQDGSYLFVAVNGDQAIQRINLKTLAIEKTFSLPNPCGIPTCLTVADMKVVPGTSQSIVVTFQPEDGVALYNENGLVNWLPDIFPNYMAVDSFAFAGNPPLVYSLPPIYDPYPTATFFGTFTIDSTGIQPVFTGHASSTDEHTGSIVVSDGTLLFTDSGNVWNPATKALLGTYNPALFFAASVVPDDSEGRTFFLDPVAQYDQQGAVAVEAYDQKSFNLVSSVSFLSASVPSTNVFGLTRWGADGFAFAVGDFVPAIGSGQVIIFRSRISTDSTTTSLVSSLNPSLIEQPVMFTATVTPTSGTPGGAVTFTNNGTPMGTATLNSSGVATLTVAFGHTGMHIITAAYAGTTDIGSSSATVSQTVSLAATTTALSSSVNPSLVGRSVTFRATVTDTIGVAPTGTVNFTNNGTVMGGATVNANGVATLTVAFGHAGVHTIIATYVGNTGFAGSASAPSTQRVNPQASTSTTLTSSCNPCLVGQPVTFSATVTSSSGIPAGTVSFTNNGVAMGSAMLNASGVATIIVSFGLATTHSIVATYSGNVSFVGSISTAFPQVVSPKAPTSTILTFSVNPSLVGQSVTFTATVTGESATPAGMITFTNNGNPMGSATLNSSGVATVTVAFGRAGMHAIAVSYVGNSNFGASSATLTETVN